MSKKKSSVKSPASSSSTKQMLDKPTPGDSMGVNFRGTGKYEDVRGHHVHAKAAFKDHVSYDAKKGFSISQDYMSSRGWVHQDMTNMQRKLFKELAESGRPNTIYEHNRIAVEALIAGGATKSEARDLVAQSVWNLRKQGVRVPTNIPWYK